MSKHPQQSRSKFFNARLTSTISISLVLFVLGLIAFLSVMANELSNVVKENIGFTVVLKDEIRKNDLNRLQQNFQKATYAKSFEYISKEDALRELTAELGENPEEFLGFNPLQASFEVKLHAQYANNDSIALIEKELRSLSSDIGEFSYRKDIVQLVNDNMKKAGVILLGLALILMSISFSLINNTIRLSVYSKRFLINTMRLVGATPGFIRKPFLLSNIGSGVLASFLAMGMLMSLIYYMTEEFQGFQTLISARLLLTVFGIILILGIVITAVAAYFATNRYIRMKADDMYLV